MAAEVYNPEIYTSNQVYSLVMAEAWPLSVMNPEASARRDALYKEVGVVPVALEPAQVYLRGHRSLTSNQTVQECGSYKVRGSGNAVLAALENDPELTTIHICSAGNAAYGAVQAAEPFGLNVICEATRSASPAKVGPLRQEGATVHNMHEEFEDGQVAARLLGEQQHHVTIEAFDQIETIAGQATMGWETLEDLLGRQTRGEVNLHTDPIKLFVPVGGGGLISGIACVVRWAKEQGLVGNDNVQVVGVQMEGCDAMDRYTSYIRSGFEPPEDLFAEGLGFDPSCDGTAVRKAGQLTSALVADPEFVADIITVTPGELGVAMEEASARHGVWVEPAGALSLAGAKRYAEQHPFDRRRPAETLITFTTGANVSPGLRKEFEDHATDWRQTLRENEAKEREAYRDYLLTLGNTGAAATVRPPRKQGHVRGTQVASSPAHRQVWRRH